MSKRIIYRKCVYERVASDGHAHSAQVASISRAVLQVARAMNERNTHSLRDDIVEVLAEVKDHLFEQVPE